ncbi:hypothetical protein C8R47DRAFT_1190086 [Mycena vitilis]|nr:hypothetical protein C8R47DRAFT_1190086 [Mycena vitilis]
MLFKLSTLAFIVTALVPSIPASPAAANDHLTARGLSPTKCEAQVTQILERRCFGMGPTRPFCAVADGQEASLILPTVYIYHWPGHVIQTASHQKKRNLSSGEHAVENTGLGCQLNTQTKPFWPAETTDLRVRPAQSLLFRRVAAKTAVETNVSSNGLRFHLNWG